jgi:hypothetical protein
MMKWDFYYVVVVVVVVVRRSAVGVEECCVVDGVSGVVNGVEWEW